MTEQITEYAALRARIEHIVSRYGDAHDAADCAVLHDLRALLADTPAPVTVTREAVALTEVARDLALASPNLTPAAALDLIERASRAGMTEEWATLVGLYGSYEGGITYRSVAPHGGPARRRFVTEWETVTEAGAR